MLRKGNNKQKTKFKVVYLQNGSELMESKQVHVKTSLPKQNYVSRAGKIVSTNSNSSLGMSFYKNKSSLCTVISLQSVSEKTKKWANGKLQQNI